MVRKVLQYAFAALLFGLGYWAIMRFGPELVARVEAAGYVVEAPEFVWVLALIPALILIRAHTLSDLPVGQQILSIFFRAAFVLAITLSLIDIQKIEQEPKTTSTVYVVDVSESVPDAALTAAREAIGEVWRKRGANEIKLVVFAREAREVPLPVGQLDLPPIPRFAGEEIELGKASDVQAGLRLAMGLFPEDRVKRLVLVTDGLETQGSLAAEVEVAKRFGIPVHYLDLTDVERPGELMVVDVKVPDSIKPAIPFKVSATVKATAPMTATCELMVDGVLKEAKEFELMPGDNTVVQETKVKEGGDRKVAVSCKAPDPKMDRFASNNRFEIPIKVPDKPKVLYIEGERRYRKNLLAALDRDFKLEVRGARGVPSSLADAKNFDLIFISDVPRVGEQGFENMSTTQMRTLERYARSGGGIVIAGGENSLGPGGYGGTYLERKVLPLRLDVQKKQDIPGLALMLVIDRSGSMSGRKIELAKDAARATLEVLQPNDELGVIAFDSSPKSVVKMQRASNRLKITESLSRLRPGGGTAIFPALDQAYLDLTDRNAKIKHIILLTDGQSNREGILELVAQSYQDKITISTVAVGRNSDQRLLMQIAEEGGGRYYYTDSPENIPKLFLKETSEVTRRALVEDRFKPRVSSKFRKLQMFKGIDMKRAPALLGYVSTRAKPKAEIIMTTHLKEPLLARWRLGLGKVVVWTSDVKNKWAHFWLKWDGYAQFWRQLIRDTRRVEKEDPSYEMIADIRGDTLEIGVDAVDDNDRFIDALTSEVKVTTPKGDEVPVQLVQTAAGRYEGRLKMETYGPYTVHGRHTPKPSVNEEGEVEDAKTYRSYAAVAWPFPAEHLVGEPDLSEVVRISSETGGSLDPSTLQLFNPEGQTKDKRVSQWGPPLYIALILLILDVLLRRIRFYGKTSVRWADVRGDG